MATYGVGVLAKTDEDIYLFGTDRNIFENTGKTEKEVGDMGYGWLKQHSAGRNGKDKSLGKWAKKKSKQKRERGGGR